MKATYLQQLLVLLCSIHTNVVKIKKNQIINIKFLSLNLPPNNINKRIINRLHHNKIYYVLYNLYVIDLTSSF